MTFFAVGNLSAIWRTSDCMRSDLNLEAVQGQQTTWLVFAGQSVCLGMCKADSDYLVKISMSRFGNGMRLAG